MPAGDPQIGEYWTLNANGGVWLIEHVTEAWVTARHELGSGSFDYLKDEFVTTSTYQDLRNGRLFVHHRTGAVRIVARVSPNFTVSHTSGDGRHAPYDTTPVAEFLATHRTLSEHGIDTSGFTARPLVGFSRLLDPERQRERQRVMAAEDAAVFAALDNVAALGFERTDAFSVAFDLHAEVPLASLGRQPINAPIQGSTASLVAGDLQAHLDVDVMAEAFLARLSPQQLELLRDRPAASEQDFLRCLSNDQWAELRTNPDLLRAVLSSAVLKFVESDPEPPRLCWDFLDDED